MKQVFISQPMKDKTDEYILEERMRAIDAAKEQLNEDVGVLDSFFQGAPHDAKPLWFLGKSLQLLSTADIAVFAPGWDEYRGCRIEYECCKQYGIPVIEL